MSAAETVVVAYLAGVFTIPGIVYAVCRWDRWRAGRGE